jgi:hypothetical protein
MCVTDAAIAHGLSPNVFVSRLRIGWPVERAFSERVGSRTTIRLTRPDGTRLSVSAAARAVGLTPDALVGRLNRGWSLLRALTTPMPNEQDGVPRQLVDVARLIRLPLHTLARLQFGRDAERPPAHSAEP